MALPISGYALLGVRQKTTDSVHSKGANPNVAQVLCSYFYVNHHFLSKIN
jgi:hypothetical protein